MRNVLILFLLCLASCTRVPDTLEPQIDFAVQDQYLHRLPSPFPPLTDEEKRQDWGKEAQVGFGFAHELDLYQAITAFKRASFLIPPSAKSRKLELDYEIILCYYLGKKYDDVIYTFEHSELRYGSNDFPAARELMIILYDSYNQTEDEKKAEQFLQYINQSFPDTARSLALSSALKEADRETLNAYVDVEPEPQPVKHFLEWYDFNKKSIRKAEWLNAVLPGAGYLYVGQKQSALTSFMLNGLFIAATYHFFHKGHIAAGAIFASFEAGWYFGGIYGAGEEAKLYNERLYESEATPLMNNENLFPVLMLKYAF